MSFTKKLFDFPWSRKKTDEDKKAPPSWPAFNPADLAGLTPGVLYQHTQSPENVVRLMNFIAESDGTVTVQCVDQKLKTTVYFTPGFMRTWFREKGPDAQQTYEAFLREMEVKDGEAD